MHPPDFMPFSVPWTDGIDTPEGAGSFRAFLRAKRAQAAPEDWALLMCVRRDGAAVGVQEVFAAAFPDRREVASGSWLGRRHQGQGLGTEMRAAVLELAFAHLGARAAETGALDGNAASIRVSEKLGYRRAGERAVTVRGRTTRELRFRLLAEGWRAHRAVAVAVAGVDDAVRALLGAL